jgi:hypothetical protein
MAFREYRRRSGATVFALRLNLETDGFWYVKWGARQRCKQGDWLVQSGDDSYTVDADVFARTYERVADATYKKSGTVWAEQAAEAAAIDTKEGRTQYEAGDYVVYNDREKTDGYAVSRAKFEEMYEPAG